MFNPQTVTHVLTNLKEKKQSPIPATDFLAVAHSLGKAIYDVQTMIPW